MTEKERWTVYPLLFLTLGIVMWGKVNSFLKVHEIECETLKAKDVQIVGADDGLRLHMAASPAAADGGELVLFSAAGKPEVVMRAVAHGGQVELATPRGLVQVRLAVVGPGGFVEAFDTRGKARHIFTGFDPRIVWNVAPGPAEEKPTGETGEGQEGTEEPAGEKATDEMPAADNQRNENARNENRAPEPGSDQNPAEEKPADGKAAGDAAPEKPAGQ